MKTPLKTPAGESPASVSIGDSEKEDASPREGEISKKRLVVLAKTDMTAQAINLKYNYLNKVL